MAQSIMMLTVKNEPVIKLSRHVMAIIVIKYSGSVCVGIGGKRGNDKGYPISLILSLFPMTTAIVLV